MFTTTSETPAVDKPLGLLLVDAQQWMSQHVLALMRQRGLELNPSEFAFLANLDCGETHASSVARRMGISRQAVYRTTRLLKDRGLLDLVDDPERRNQKIVVMTEPGMRVVTAARTCLAEAEAELVRRIGAARVAALTEALSMPWDAGSEAQ